MKQAEVVQVLHFIEPATAKEIAERADENPKSVSGPLNKLYRQGILERERRPKQGMGRDPDEYSIAEP